jgi:UDP-glucose 4-epimerase
LVTGATGFVGGAIAARLSHDAPGQVRIAARRAPGDLSMLPLTLVADLGPDTDWRDAVRGVVTVVHAAARVHVMRESSANPLAEFRRANVEGTLRLAGQAAEAGVRRFVFISSIKVNGEATGEGRPYTAADPPAPVDPYGVSKLEAEEALRALARGTGLEVVVIRPVLVYGPGVKGNFRSMLRWLRRGLPLPLGAIDNARSLVSLDNLVDLIAVCVRHPGAAHQTFLASDGEDLSTPELLRRTAAALGTHARLLPVPAPMLRAAACVVGRGDAAQRLCGSLQVDIRSTRARLGWTPPTSVDAALRRTAAAFLGQAE